MSREAAIASIRGIIDTVYGVQGAAIEGYSPSPRPKGAYASVDVLSYPERGGVSSKVAAVDGGYSEEISRLIEITLSVNFYRDGAYDSANKFITQVATAQAIRELYNSGLGLTKVSGVRNLDLVVKGSIERRAQVDVFLNYVSVVSSPIDIIESVEISGGIE